MAKLLFCRNREIVLFLIKDKRRHRLLRAGGVTEMMDIEVRAMSHIDVGIPEDIAKGWAFKAIEDLESKGVTTIVKNPWE